MAMMQSTEACVKSACVAGEENGVDGEGGFFAVFIHAGTDTYASRGDVWEALDDLYSNAKLDQGPKCRSITIDFLSTGSDRRTDSDIGVVIFGHHCR